jgi:hydrogenase small subunit
MQASRREFLKLCRNASAALGLGTVDLGQLERALANPNAPTVIWLQGSSCTGCSVSFLNRIAATAPRTAADVLIETVNLAYHPNLMAAAGDSAVSVALQAYNKGGYILAIEGGVPTAFGGNTCWAWSYQGKDVTFQQAVTDLAGRASQILCVGTCASWGGLAALPPNPTGVKGVGAATLRKTVNLGGCPVHPDWVVWAIAKLLTNSIGALDGDGRPTALYRKTVHDQCPRKGTESATMYGQDQRCLKSLGCKGPQTRADCPISRWNGGMEWCVGANGLCIGCTSPDFGQRALRK